MPFILKAGKALNERVTVVRLQLKAGGAPLFGGLDRMRNEIVIRFQPGACCCCCRFCCVYVCGWEGGRVSGAGEGLGKPFCACYWRRDRCGRPPHPPL